MCVRSRSPKDLDAFRKRYCPKLGKTIKSTKDWADYPCRAFTTKRAFGDAMRRAAKDIDYTNYKSRVMTEQGYTRESIYMRVWGELRDAQRQGKFEVKGDKAPPYKFDSKGSKASQGRLFSSLTDFDDGLGGYVENGPTYRVRSTKSSDFRTQRPPPSEVEHKPRGFLSDDEANDPFFWRDDTGRTSRDVRSEDNESDDDNSEEAVDYESFDRLLRKYRDED